jgi:hypothetical protein
MFVQSANRQAGQSVVYYRQDKGRENKTMKNNNRIEELKNMIFMLNMKDRWNNEDYDRMAQWKRELRELESTQA